MACFRGPVAFGLFRGAAEDALAVRAGLSSRGLRFGT